MKTTGFTLVECLAAALVLSLGVLATVASISATQRLALLGRRTSGATEVAASRLAALAATACAAPSGGAAVTGAYGENWTVTASGALRATSVTVTFVHDARSRVLRFDATLLCP
jgi:Tfp pilus assembly protein PilV